MRELDDLATSKSMWTGWKKAHVCRAGQTDDSFSLGKTTRLVETTDNLDAASAIQMVISSLRMVY